MARVLFRARPPSGDPEKRTGTVGKARIDLFFIEMIPSPVEVVILRNDRTQQPHPPQMDHETPNGIQGGIGRWHSPGSG